MSPREIEVLNLLAKEGLNYAQVARRLNLSKKTIQNIASKLRKKGEISRTWEGREREGGRLPKSSRKMKDLHAQQFNIRIISVVSKTKFSKYQNRVLPDYQGNEVRVHTETIEIYSTKRFMREERAAAEIAASEYWTYIFKMIERDMGVEIIRNRVPNIEVVKGEIAELDHELAKDAKRKKKPIKIRGSFDDKVWLMTDDSFNEKHTEYVHAKKHSEDCDKISPFFNNLRDRNEIITMDDVFSAIIALADRQSQTEKEIRDVAVGLKSLVEIERQNRDKGQTAPQGERLSDKDNYFG